MDISTDSCKHHDRQGCLNISLLFLECRSSLEPDGVTAETSSGEAILCGQEEIRPRLIQDSKKETSISEKEGSVL